MFTLSTIGESRSIRPCLHCRFILKHIFFSLMFDLAVVFVLHGKHTEKTPENSGAGVNL